MTGYRDYDAHSVKIDRLKHVDLINLSTINGSKYTKSRREPVMRVGRLSFQFCVKITTTDQVEFKTVGHTVDDTHAVIN